MNNRKLKKQLLERVKPYTWRSARGLALKRVLDKALLDSMPYLLGTEVNTKEDYLALYGMPDQKSSLQDMHDLVVDQVGRVFAIEPQTMLEVVRVDPSEEKAKGCPKYSECTEGNKFGKGCFADPLQNAMGGTPWQECHCGIDSEGLYNPTKGDPDE